MGRMGEWARVETHGRASQTADLVFGYLKLKL